ncbi:MAG TPA: 4-alpha-glucanotransferase [Candidatus Sulfotelmatobacter sp.]|nr:4-alpha-glucanotransferase [Candidatus Sulfotelmatobacter sp.]
MTRVARRYVDALGQEREAPAETVGRFDELLREPPYAFTPPTLVVREDEPLAVAVTLPAARWHDDLRWTLDTADGERASGTFGLRGATVVRVGEDGEQRFDTRVAELRGPLPLGRHALTLEVAGYARERVTVVVVPRLAYPPRGRTWGIALQLYTLRSQRNHGIGDFADLRAVCTLLGARGASYVGINPLHAPFRSDPEAASPYAASSRRWLNWLAIALDDVPEAHAAGVRAVLDDPAWRARVAAARACDDVDYAAVSALKEPVLRACYAALAHDRARADAFARWCAEQGDPLQRFAAFEVLIERHGRDLTAWPAGLRAPDLPDVALALGDDAAALGYAMYLQWLADQQLAAVAAAAAQHGVALYRDLAVGVDAGAADVWADRAAYVGGVRVGAPPDVLNTFGQDWGLPPLDPRTLADDGYAQLLALLQANCRYAGALRIDHAFSLARLYWIPAGAGASDGTYVSYPLDDLRGIVALASVRERCVVIGEDLGTVPDGFRERMEATGILAYRILFFERHADGTFAAPEEYPAAALAASGTHDLATIPAWLHGDDLLLREQLGLARTPLTDEQASRERERTLLLDTLQRHGDLAGNERDDETAIVVAANRYLAASPCAIVMGQLDDVLGERRPVNVPGTSLEYPNWRRKLSTTVEALADDLRVARLCTAFNEIRPRENGR